MSTYHDKDILRNSSTASKNWEALTRLLRSWILLAWRRLQEGLPSVPSNYEEKMGSEQELETWKPRRHVCMPTLMPYSSHLLRGRWQYKQILERNVFPRSIRCQGHMKKARRCAREYRVHPCNGHSAVASAHSNKCPNGHLRGDHISQGTVRHIIAELGLKTRAAACENINHIQHGFFALEGRKW